MPHRQLGVRLFPWIIALLPLQACALSGESIQGQVLEESTNKPIPGAIVVARWQGEAFSFAHSPTICIHVESTTTDNDGRYRLPAWSAKVEPEGVRNIRPLLDAYKPGYGLPTVPSQKQEIVLLKPFTGTRGERLEHLRRMSSGIRCSNPGESEKNLLALRRAFLEETKQLVGSEYDKDFVEPFLFQLEVLEFGYEVAQRRQVERLSGKK